MARSVFDSRTIRDVHDEIRQVYLADNRPWILGYSGGKDSTCMVQLIWDALASLPAPKLRKSIYVISSDTLVESPKIVQQITDTLDMMERAAKEASLPISTNLVRPKTEDSFWVCLLGKGFPAPSNLFRWCTERLKIRNADRFIKEKVSEYGEAIVVLGTRRDESGSRQQLMSLYEIKGSLLSRHSKFPSTYVYTPVRDFTAKDVWNYLLQNRNPWGSNNRDLLALYQNAKAAECPLVVDTNTPSCGNSRFGCWTCTVVDKDTSLRNTIRNGEEWMQPLLELRQELKDTQDPEVRKKVRSLRRRTGQMKLVDEMRRKSFQERIEKARGEREDKPAKPDPYEVLAPGPYTMEFRVQFLEKLLLAEQKVQREGPDPTMSLIHEDEIREIQRIWRMEWGDWRNTAYVAYERIAGRRLYTADDADGFGGMEQDILEETCAEAGVPARLVAELLNAEVRHKGMARHSRIFREINRILGEEWRDDMDAIIADLEKKRQDTKKYGGASR